MKIANQKLNFEWLWIKTILQKNLLDVLIDALLKKFIIKISKECELIYEQPQLNNPS